MLSDNLFIGARVYMLAERIKKRSTPVKFYKQYVQNISYFNKDIVFTIQKKKKNIGDITYSWVKNRKNNKNVTKRFSLSELFALHTNFL